MTLAPQRLAQQLIRLDRHLARIAAARPTRATDFKPMTDASDAVILHLWQAVQLTIDVAVSACVAFGVGSPQTYGDAFRKLACLGVLDEALAERLVAATGFRNLVAHGYDDIDLQRVWLAAGTGPADLRACLLRIGEELCRRG